MDKFDFEQRQQINQLVDFVIEDPEKAAEKIVKLEAENARLEQEKSKWYEKGRESVLRDNHSGCCCMFNEDESELIEPCLFHKKWKDEAVARLEQERGICEAAIDNIREVMNLESINYQTLSEQVERVVREKAELVEALRLLLEEYEDRKAQFGDHCLWQKHEDAEAVEKAEAALKGGE